ncbi:hypothetical protein PR048_002916 [Dryococelus australis]|uniref:Uncharacterized protein n=1 Tax=Dryococelus australis TaxID=614101 RepID=A0ABQ9ILM6_9NEOP|nr:hypothetical protein PR048_002916 [Dryococelus australis]
MKKASAMACKKQPSQHSPRVISGKHRQPKCVISAFTPSSFLCHIGAAGLVRKPGFDTAERTLHNRTSTSLKGHPFLVPRERNGGATTLGTLPSTRTSCASTTPQHTSSRHHFRRIVRATPRVAEGYHPVVQEALFGIRQPDEPEPQPEAPVPEQITHQSVENTWIPTNPTPPRRTAAPLPKLVPCRGAKVVGPDFVPSRRPTSRRRLSPRDREPGWTLPENICVDRHVQQPRVQRKVGRTHTLDLAVNEKSCSPRLDLRFSSWVQIWYITTPCRPRFHDGMGIQTSFHQSKSWSRLLTQQLKRRTTALTISPKVELLLVTYLLQKWVMSCPSRKMAVKFCNFFVRYSKVWWGPIGMESVLYPLGCGHHCQNHASFVSGITAAKARRLNVVDSFITSGMAWALSTKWHSGKEAAPECNGCGNERSPRKPANQRRRRGRFPHAKIGERLLQKSNPVFSARMQGKLFEEGIVRASKSGHVCQLFHKHSLRLTKKYSALQWRTMENLRNNGVRARNFWSKFHTQIFLRQPVSQFSDLNCHYCYCFTSNQLGAEVAERLACSPPTKPNRAQSPAGSLPDFCTWESFPTMSLVGGFFRASPVSPALSFGRCSIHTTFQPHWLSRTRC